MKVPNDQDTLLTQAHNFLHAAYPELFDKGFFLEMSVLQPIDESWQRISGVRFQVDRYDPRSETMLNPPFDPKTGKRLPPPKNVVCRGSIRFTSGGRLDQFSLDGALVRLKDNKSIEALVESHPEWSESQAFAALKNAGARYGPENRDEFIKAIRLAKYEPFLGHFTVKSVEFGGLSEPHEGNFASLRWRVKLDVELPGNKQTAYTLIFEPFDGKLTQIIHGLWRPY